MTLEKTRNKLKDGEYLVIAALGDSLTEGWMVDQGYLNFLEAMIYETYPNADIRIINSGIAGDTAAGGMSRVKRDVISHNPDLAVIEFALNDAFMGHSIEKFKNNIKGIIKAVKDQSKAEILLLTSVPMNSPEENEIMRQFYDTISVISAEENTALAEVHKYIEEKLDEGLSRKDLFMSDMVHPTSNGYRLMAECVMKLLI